MSSSKRYRLLTSISNERYSIGQDEIIEDDGSSWIVAGKSFDHRGSVWEGELALWLDYARDNELTSILEPLEPADTPARPVVPDKLDLDYYATQDAFKLIGPMARMINQQADCLEYLMGQKA